MPANMRPLEPVSPPTHPWIIDNLIPTCQIVFLDGVSGVGKSMFCAHLASSFSGVEGRESSHRILYISSKRQLAERDDHLRKQQANLGMLVEAPFDIEKPAFGMPEPLIPFKLLDHIRAQVEEQPTFFVILDDLEELLAPAGPIDQAMMENFWNELQDMANLYLTTFVIPRRHGLHESRNYGTYTRTGNDAARFILTMQYHPWDPRQRVVTVARNLRGPAGIQWHYQFDTEGKLVATRVEPHQEVNPSNKLRTWTPDLQQARDDNSFAVMIAEHMNGQPATKADLLEHAKSKGYSANQFKNAMSRLKLPRLQRGTTQLYSPTFEMLRMTHGLPLRDIANRPRSAEPALPQEPARTTPPTAVSPLSSTKQQSSAA